MTESLLHSACCYQAWPQEGSNGWKMSGFFRDVLHQSLSGHQ